MTYRIIGNDRKRALEWALGQFPNPVPGDFDKASALILEKDCTIRAVVVYSHWYPATSVQISVASLGGRWLTRPFLAAVFRNPFIEWDMRRVESHIAADNAQSIRFCEHLGFVQEGRLRQGSGPGIDTLIYGMLKSECRFLGDEYLGKQRQRPAGT